MDAKMLKVNIAKTKVMASGIGYDKTESSVKWPCE